MLVVDSDDPDYNPKTLYLPPSFLKSLSGGQVVNLIEAAIWVSLFCVLNSLLSCVNMQRQWWDFKSKHMDKVLFFKVLTLILLIYGWFISFVGIFFLIVKEMWSFHFTCSTADGKILWIVWNGCTRRSKGAWLAIHEGKSWSEIWFHPLLLFYLFILFHFWIVLYHFVLTRSTWHQTVFYRESNLIVVFQKRTSLWMQKSWQERS